MKLPEPPDLALLLVRTDYSDDGAWRRVVEAVTSAYEHDGFDEPLGALLRPVEGAGLSDLEPEDLVLLPREGYLSGVAVADLRSMRDHTLKFVDFNELNEDVGRNFRCIPEQVAFVVANLSLANMDFFEYADSVDADGVFRGF